jgi:hypothetical protein
MPSAAFEFRLRTIPPGGELLYEESDWLDALVTVEFGEIELETVCGTRRRFGRGDVLWLAGLPLRAVGNPGSEPALISAVSRRTGRLGSLTWR